MICFDVFLNGEKLCRAGKEELEVMSSHVTFVDTKFDDDHPLALSVGGLYEHPTRGRLHPGWIPRRRLDPGDEVIFRIIESEVADEPVIEETYEPEDREKQERKYYEFLKAKYESENKSLTSIEYPERVSHLLDVATVWIDEAAETAGRLNGERRRETMKHLAAALESILEAKAISFNSPPYEGGVAAASADGVFLSSQNPERPEPDGPMSPEQQARVDQLTEAEVQIIDASLLSNALHRFQKVAMIVAKTMDSPLHQKGIPDLFYAERIQHLVAQGKLESEGNLNYMRFSEVRLPETHLPIEP